MILAVIFETKGTSLRCLIDTCQHKFLFLAYEISDFLTSTFIGTPLSIGNLSVRIKDYHGIFVLINRHCSGSGWFWRFPAKVLFLQYPKCMNKNIGKLINFSHNYTSTAKYNLPVIWGRYSIVV